MSQIIARGSDLFNITCPFSGPPPSSLSPISTAPYNDRNKAAAALIYNLFHSQSRFYEESNKNLSIGQFKAFPSPSAKDIRNEAERNSEVENEEDEDENNKRVNVETVGLMAAMEKNHSNVSGQQQPRLAAPTEEEECCILPESGNK